ncbi:MAG: GAF domain-containing protein [Nitrospirota bacterium]
MNIVKNPWYFIRHIKEFPSNLENKVSLYSEGSDIDKLLNWIVGVIVVGFVILSFFFFQNVTVLWMSVSFLVTLLVIHNFILLKARGDEKRSKSRASQLTTLQEISFGLTSTLHMDEVLDLIPKSAVKLVQVDGCIVGLAGKMKEGVIPKAKEGIQTDLMEIGTKEKISSWIVENKALQAIPELSLDSRTPTWIKNEGFISYLGLPLKARDEIIGVLELYTKTSRLFTSEEIDLLNIFAAQSATALDNARLYGVTKEALQREITSSMALLRIEQAITSKFDIKEQLALLMDGAIKVTSAEKASIWLIDDISGEVACKGTYPYEEKLDRSSVRVGEGITGWVAKEGLIQNIPDLSQDSRFVNPLKQDLRSQLAAPLKYKEKTIGVINVFNSKREEGFTEIDETILMVIATQAAVSLQTAKLYTELKTAANALSVLYEISKTISEGKELHEILKLILKRSSEIFQAQHGSVMLLDESTGELTIKVAEGLTDEIIKNTVKRPGDGSIAGWVAKEKEPLLLIGEVKDLRFKSAKAETEIKDAMSAPLILKDKLIGVFNISNRVGAGVFTESDLNLLCILANEVSIAIETARLYEMITQRVTELSSFYVISTALSSTLSISEILKIIMERITTLFPQFAVSISFYDEKKNQLNRVTERGFGEDKTIETEFELNDELKAKLETVLVGKRYLCMPSIEGMVDLRVLVGTGKIESFLLIPLIAKDKVTGILSLVSQFKQPVSKEELRLIMAISQAAASAIDNAKLYTQTSRRLQELMGLQQIAGKMALSMNTTEILGLAVNIINEVINAEIGMLFLWDEDRNEYVVKVGHGKKRISEGLFKTLKFKMGDGIIGWVGEKGQGVILDDVRKDPRFRPMGDLYIQNLIAIPIIKDKKTIGVMNFMNKLPSGVFTSEDERMISIIANQIVIVLSNTEAFDGIKRRALQLSTVQAVNKMIGSVFGVDDLLPQIVELTAKVSRVKKASLSLLAPDGTVKLETSYGLTYMEQEREEKLQLGQGIAGKVIQTNQPIMINNLSEDTTLTEEEKNIYIEKSYLSVPLIIRKKTVGALNVCSKLNDTFFNEQDMEILSTISDQSSVVIEYAKLYQDAQKHSLETLKALSLVIETRDPFTKGHSDAVARYVLEIGKELNLSKEDLKILETAALLHDIGKIGIKEGILLKTERELSIEEHREIRNHPFLGTQMLRPLEFLKEVIPIIYHHHEWYDGKGYLDGLAGEKIPLLARIIRVADTFDAMTSSRAFRESISDEEAIEELKEQSGKQFDPKVVDAFLKIHPIIRKDAIEKTRKEKEKKKKEGKSSAPIGEHKIWDRYE